MLLFWLSGMALAESHVPLISDVLTCGREGKAGNLGPGTELQRYTFDAAEYPLALCNDGSPAIFYYRPFQGAANRDRWVIQLQGGGSCATANDCAKRWCSVDTNFSMVGMSSNPAPKLAIDGRGILERRADNPMGNFNQVYVKYCSSDMWSGAIKDELVEAADPITGEPLVMRLHFLGSRIVDAAVSVLRRQGGKTLRYGPGANQTDMPNLDDAEFVVLAGASGGGMGVANNLDRFADLLRRTNNACRGKESCPLVVRGLHDSALPPSVINLDFSTSMVCQVLGLCTPQAYLQAQADFGSDMLWRARGDESCAEWHRKNDPDGAWQCIDNTHVLMNHITTPVFVRMGQSDENLSGAVLEQNYTVPGQGIMTLEDFMRIVRVQMADLAGAKTKAHEGADIGVAPGGFSPTCPDHEVLSDTTQVFNVRITQGGQPYTMFGVIQNWIEGRAPAMVVAPGPGANNCPQ